MGTTTHLEVEIKLDADADFALPDLAGLPGVERVERDEPAELEAVYLDSADLRLTRAGVSLRRRTGGSDAGWHLKLPAGVHGRLEVRRAPGRSVRTVPAALTGLVRARLRGAAVEPVARIATTRAVLRLVGADGAVLAEVADDAVTAESLGAAASGTSWREIEVELVTGDRDLLDAAAKTLTAAGARESDASSKVGRALGARLAALAPAGPSAATKPEAKKRSKQVAQAKEPAIGDVAVAHLREQAAALTDADPAVRLEAEDSVHKMRVATRRLRSALATFRPLLAEGAGEPLREELKWLGEVLGRARDAEVIRDRLLAAVAAQPAELVLGPVRRRIELELRAAWREGHAGVVEALDGDRYLALLDALDAFAADPPFTGRAGRPADDEAAKLVRRADRRVERAVAAVDAGHGEAVDQDHPLHEVRKAAKRARYAAEAVAPAVGKRATQLAAAMEAVQETLGDHQDSVVERVWLRDLGVRAHLAGENGFTFGRLHGLAEARARHDEEVFTEVWAAARTRALTWPG